MGLGEPARDDSGELPDRTDDITKSMIDCNSKKCSKKGVKKAGRILLKSFFI